MKEQADMTINDNGYDNDRKTSWNLTIRAWWKWPMTDNDGDEIDDDANWRIMVKMINRRKAMKQWLMTKWANRRSDWLFNSEENEKPVESEDIEESEIPWWNDEKRAEKLENG